MKNPTPEQVQLVIDNLTKAAKLAKNNCPIRMMRGRIERKHPCGTPMCHAGWYGLVTTESSFYWVGADQMAKDLGFEHSFELIQWAAIKPKLWGNKYGDFMFLNSKAFGLYDDELTSLHQIIEHWKGVKERLINLNK